MALRLSSNDFAAVALSAAVDSLFRPAAVESAFMSMIRDDCVLQELKARTDGSGVRQDVGVESGHSAFR